MKSKPKKKNTLKAVIIILVCLSALIFILTDFITDLLWFNETGYVDVFLKELTTQIKIGLPVFAAATVLAVLFFSGLKRNFLKRADMEIAESSYVKRIKLLIWIISVVFSVITMFSAVGELWFEILQFFNSTDFNIKDPLFGNDLGFYVFKLEFLTDLNSSLTQTVLLLFGFTVVFYILLMGYSTPRKSVHNVESGNPSKDGSYEYNDEDAGEEAPQDPFEYRRNPLRKIFGLDERQLNGIKRKGKAMIFVAAEELTALAVVFFLSLALNYWLYGYQLLYKKTGVAFGAGFTDINVTLNICRAMMVLSVLSAVMVIVARLQHRIRRAFVLPAVMVVVFFLTSPVAALVQNLVVSPDEINKEGKYIGYNIDFTRQAYNLNNIEVKDFDPDNNLSQADVLDNMETFANIRINDFEPAEQFYNQTQSIRSYYTFNDVDVDRYMVNGEYSQVFLSAREIDQDKIDDQWMIQHLKYTHGYGITLSRVDKVTSSGQPDMLIDSIPPVSDVKEIEITRPEIYFGESAFGYVVVNSDEEEFDYPSGEANVYCKYEGSGGIPMTFFNRLMYSIKYRSIKLLISNNINKDSRILVYRNIVDRVNKIAPFLVYDSDPYIVAEDGRLYWIFNAYTTSAYYPYSEPYSEYSDVNYIRNSVKVVVDAYNGDVNFYICDAEDPIVLTMQKIYPELFKPLNEMSSGLRMHLQYPNALFEIQADVYKKYHTTDVGAFYQSEDRWSIANEVYGQSETQLNAINFIMKLPGEDDAEFISSIPYTPSGKSNMTGLLVARNDGENYGQLVLYRLPKDRTIYGPAQIEAQINQDSEISKEFSLWNNSGASYSRGNLFVFPVNGSLIYCEPIYMESSTSSLPEVKRVVMYYGDKVAYEPTLADCLNSLFGEGTGDPLNTVNPIETGHEMAEALRLKLSEPEVQPEEVLIKETEAEGETAEVLTLPELASQAEIIYDNAVNALKSGDWAAYGLYMEKLEAILKEMNE